MINYFYFLNTTFRIFGHNVFKICLNAQFRRIIYVYPLVQFCLLLKTSRVQTRIVIPLVLLSKYLGKHCIILQGVYRTINYHHGDLHNPSRIIWFALFGLLCLLFIFLCVPLLKFLIFLFCFFC